MFKYYIVHKPFNVLSQFSKVPGKKTLIDFYKLSKDVYPVGRLDYDSEGLLILTNDKQLNNLLLNPSFNHQREYWVQVEGEINQEALSKISNGVNIKDQGKNYFTKPCKAEIFKHKPIVFKREPAIRFRKTVSDSWFRLIMTEGRNRQVRKMTAAVGYPTLRLIRNRIENISIADLAPGEMKSLAKKEMYNLLNIKN